MKTTAAFATTTLLACVGAISADAQPPPEPQDCEPAAIVGGEAREAVVAVLRDRGIGEPADGCPAVEAQVDPNGVGYFVTIIDGDQATRRAATPEVAARLIQDAAESTSIAFVTPFRPVLPELAVITAGDPVAPGPWLDVPVEPAALLPSGDFDYWESVALDGILGGPVQIEGFSVRAGGYVGPELPYLDRPFGVGPAPSEIDNEVSGGGARVLVRLPNPYAERDLNVSVGAGIARFAGLVPFDEDADTDLEDNPLRIAHFGIGFDLGPPERTVTTEPAP